MLLAVAGWIVAGIAGASAVRAHQEIWRTAALAGLTPVSGPGVEVTLSDSTRALAPAENPSEALVQDSDLLLLEMMLWYGGARAVAVNGVRITAETTIISSGPTVVVDGHRMVAPFHVSAVGVGAVAPRRVPDARRVPRPIAKAVSASRSWYGTSRFRRRPPA